MMDIEKYIDIVAGCGGLFNDLLSVSWTGLFTNNIKADAFSTLEYNLIEKQEHILWVLWLPIKECDINVLLNNNTTVKECISYEKEDLGICVFFRDRDIRSSF